MQTRSTAGCESRLAGKRRVVESAYAELIAEALQRGFFGTATLTLNVQDGHVQQARVATERLIR